MGLLLTLALAGMVFGWFEQEPVEARFVRFDRATNGYAARAIVKLANRSGKPMGDFHKDYFGVVYCQFRTPSPTGEVVWRSPPNPHMNSAAVFVLSPHSQVETIATMPEDGRTGRVAVVWRPLRASQPAWVVRVRALLHIREPRWPQEKLIICDQVIQSSLVLPDGTVQPPRLLSEPKGIDNRKSGP